MRPINKTRYAILGMLLDSPCTGYEIKSLMARSTVYFWRESDSTLYPMLKVLAKEGKVSSKTIFIGKKCKEVFSITKLGRAEFQEWMAGTTAGEIPRNEFLLKLFFATDEKEAMWLFDERLEKIKERLEVYKKIEERLVGLEGSSRQTVRLKALRYGIDQQKHEIQWLKKEILEYAHHETHPRD